MIDTNVYLSRWPFRRLPGDDTDALVKKLHGMGVTQAWVGSFDALLHRDIAGVNERLAAECRRESPVRLVPFGAVNPLAPDWEEDLRRCAEIHAMPGIRLHPNYHGYDLEHAAFAQLLAAAEERKMVVQIALRMEDPRTQHPLVAVADVSAVPLVKGLGARPKLGVQLLNAMAVLRPDLLDKLVTAGNLSVEIAMLEGVNGLEKTLSHAPLERVLFGSYFPFFAGEAAQLKLQESPLAAMQREAIGERNAAMLLQARL